MKPLCNVVRAAGMALVCLFVNSGIPSFAVEDSKYPYHPKTSLSVSSSNLPLVLITLDERMADKEADKRVSASMKIIWHKDGQRNQLTDTDAYDYDGKIGIKYRGNSSYNMSAKKPFGVRIQDENGKKQKASILGMGEDQDWALLAPYNDKSMIRDVLLFDLMRGSLEYVPTGKYCEVFLNGIYQGVYIMTARVRQGANRINIKGPTDDSGDGVTGGYHLEIDRNDDPGFWGVVYPLDAWGVHVAKSNAFYQMKYPDWEDLTGAQKSYIKDHVWKMERSIDGDDFKDPKKGFRAYLDTTSLADYYIAQELSRNTDGYRLSTPLYKDKDSVDPRFKFSIWDFNIAMGNADYHDGWSTEGWVWNNTRFSDDQQVPAMFKRILEDETFRQSLKDRWNDHRQSRFSDEDVFGKIDSLVALLDEAQERNFKVWPRFNTYVWPNYYVSSSWNDEIRHLRTWIEKRIRWIDSQWAEEKVENLVPNGSFDASGERGYSSEVKLSEWSKTGNAYPVKEHKVSGNYAVTLYPHTTVWQVISELTPGTYKLTAWVKTTDDPKAYMYVRKNRGGATTGDARQTIQADADFYQIIFDDLEIDNKALEIGFATEASTATARLWVDDVVLTRKDGSVANEPITRPARDTEIRVDREQLQLTAHVDREQIGQSLEIFEITGRKLFARKITSQETQVGNIFQSNMIYIVRIGGKAQKVAF